MKTENVHGDNIIGFRDRLWPSTLIICVTLITLKLIDKL